MSRLATVPDQHFFTRRRSPTPEECPMEVSLMLCDHAVVAEGKLYINGGGWDQTPANLPPTSLAALVFVPWDEMNVKWTLALRLVDEDGAPALQPGSTDTPIALQAELEVGRPVGLRPGSTVSVPLAFNFSPVQLKSNKGYEWRAECNGEPVGSVRFRTRSVSDPSHM